MRKTILALALAAALGACASQPDESADLDALDLLSRGRAPASQLPRLIEEASRHPLGSRENPIRVNMPPGERAYLARLRCSDGAAPTFNREGSGGGGAFGSIVDIYDVRCANGEPRQSTIWMDMYHPTHDETAAPQGFSLAPR
jgi:hypothetical protein